LNERTKIVSPGEMRRFLTEWALRVNTQLWKSRERLLRRNADTWGIDTTRGDWIERAERLLKRYSGIGYSVATGNPGRTRTVPEPEELTRELQEWIDAHPPGTPVGEGRKVMARKYDCTPKHIERNTKGVRRRPK
jgi:hypothetical protein